MKESEKIFKSLLDIEEQSPYELYLKNIIPIIDQILENEPNDFYANYLKALYQLGEGKYLAAFSYYRKSNQNLPSDNYASKSFLSVYQNYLSEHLLYSYELQNEFEEELEILLIRQISAKASIRLYYKLCQFYCITQNLSKAKSTLLQLVEKSLSAKKKSNNFNQFNLVIDDFLACYFELQSDIYLLENQKIKAFKAIEKSILKTELFADSDNNIYKRIGKLFELGEQLGRFKQTIAIINKVIDGEYFKHSFSSTKNKNQEYSSISKSNYPWIKERMDEFEGKVED